mmetsp:Transcript_54071/g.122300  ORF Transcript_54071/g.122300 Transcript_54071/m.122300 type:complete len:270 (-) Transcript_54071:153-962(-)
MASAKRSLHSSTEASSMVKRAASAALEAADMASDAAFLRRSRSRSSRRFLPFCTSPASTSAASASSTAAVTASKSVVRMAALSAAEAARRRLRSFACSLSSTTLCFSVETSHPFCSASSMAAACRSITSTESSCSSKAFSASLFVSSMSAFAWSWQRRLRAVSSFASSTPALTAYSMVAPSRTSTSGCQSCAFSIASSTRFNANRARSFFQRSSSMLSTLARASLRSSRSTGGVFSTAVASLAARIVANDSSARSSVVKARRTASSASF